MMVMVDWPSGLQYQKDGRTVVSIMVMVDWPSGLQYQTVGRTDVSMMVMVDWPSGLQYQTDGRKVVSVMVMVDWPSGLQYQTVVLAFDRGGPADDVTLPLDVDTRRLLPLPLQEHTIRYDTRCYFYVRAKADMSQLNLPHGTDN